MISEIHTWPESERVRMSECMSPLPPERSQLRHRPAWYLFRRNGSLVRLGDGLVVARGVEALKLVKRLNKRVWPPVKVVTE